MNQKFRLIYKILLEEYGPQGWWPVYSLRNTESRDDRGYYLGYVPVETHGRASLRGSAVYEIAIGAVLTQNTAWTNVEKALTNLIKKNMIDPGIISNIDQEELAELIRPSGYYNQKAKKLKILTHFLQEGDFFKDGYIPERDDLLKLWGIGEETTDSILLYAYNFPVFVVDAYTKRIFMRLGILDGIKKYDEIARLFTNNLERKYTIYQEYHALIVRHAKEHCKKTPNCIGCVLNNICLKYKFSQR